MAMLKIEPLHSEFGARITGIDLRKPLPAAAVEEIRAAIDDYSFLCFPDQPLNDDLQLALTRIPGSPSPVTCSPTSCGVSTGSDRSHVRHDRRTSADESRRRDWCVSSTPRTATFGATRPHSAPSDDIGEAVVANRSPLAGQTISCQIQLPSRDLT